MKIVEMIKEGKYDLLKDELEKKVATKIKEKIEDKKKAFVAKMKKSKG